ncbi:LPS translocon maturation chaperone LptM [Spectribacter hydrogenooxidans]|uniref:Lipoprotein n=1 Tax=Spectribacter hydrogenoxidans TaxID=3075608 RepID=A0ABU3BW95_9GAMM|nr:lipoprotein [Salinisphaera sp. W335]MDT0633547.1 lipoprotein [Salinisphaera sp. W335]
MSRPVTALLLIITLLAAGCGQKGDLYLPDEENNPGEQASQE